VIAPTRRPPPQSRRQPSRCFAKARLITQSDRYRLPKLDASDHLESSVGTPQPGDCLEKPGKRASAWAAFHGAEGPAFQRGGDYKRRAEAIDGLRVSSDMTRLIPTSDIVSTASHRAMAKS
jgi:hypothetical protein